MDRRPTGPHEVGGHQCLAMARGERVPCAKPDRRDDRQEGDRRGQLREAEDGRDLRPDAARHRNRRRGGPWAWAGGSGIRGCETRQPRDLGNVDRRQGGTAGLHADRHRHLVERQLQQVRRIGGQSLRQRRRSQRGTAGCRDRDAVRLDHDLAPAQRRLAIPIGEGDRPTGGGQSLSRVGGDELADQPHRRRPCRGPRREGEAGAGQPDLEGNAVQVDRDVGGELAAVGLTDRVDLGRRQVAILVGVDPDPFVEGGNLGPVDHHVEADLRIRQPQPGVDVGREIAQGMGGRDQWRGEGRHDPGQGGHIDGRAAARVGRVGGASHDAEGTPQRGPWMIGPAAHRAPVHSAT